MAEPDATETGALFARARRGDAVALDALCRRMRPRLVRIAQSVVRDADEADDVAQDALVRAITRRFTFAARGHVEGWMGRIALNLARNRVRDARRRRELEDLATPLEKHRALGAGPAAPDAQHDDARARAALDDALAALPPRQREVLTLRLVGELPFKEIADLLGITEENARVTSSLAQKKVRSALAARGLAPAGGGS